MELSDEDAKLERATDDVVSPVLISTKCAAFVLSHPASPWLLWVCSVGSGAGQLLAAQSGATSREVTDLFMLAKVCLGATYCVMPILLFSLRHVTRVDGALVQLGVGEAKISERDNQRLKCWLLPLAVVSLPWIFIGVAVFVVLGVVGSTAMSDTNKEWLPPPGETTLTHQQRIRALTNGVVFAVITPLGCAWYLALKQASIHVSNEIVETRRLIATTAATSTAWDAEVVPAVQKLVKHTLPILSRGFGLGLLAVAVSSWFAALGQFCMFLDDPSDWAFTMVQAMLFGCAPLLVALDVAGASSDCDSIGTSLNNKRGENMKLEVDASVQLLERHLDRLNRLQGLGFVVAGKVLDRTTVRNAFIAMSSMLGTIVPIVLALQQSAAATVNGGEACALTAAQVQRVRAAMLEHNTSCHYDNVTIGSVLQQR